MSVMRGSFLRRLLAVLPTKTFHSRKITLLLFACVLGAVVISTDLILSGLAARRSRAERNTDTVPASIAKLRPMTSRGPLASRNACAAPFASFQGCTVGCTATVPGTGTIGAAVQFSSTATPSGCGAAQPIYDWDFGDGTANSSQQNPSHTYATAGQFTWTLTTSVSSGGLMIDTVAGGLGEGNPALQTPFGTLGAIARDPQGRGVYVADANDDGVTLVRFINTGAAAVTLGGRSIEAGAVRAIAGGGIDFNTNNVPALQSDVGSPVSGLAVSGDGALVYFANRQDGLVRAVNVSASPVTVAGVTINSGNVGTLAAFEGSSLNGLAVHPTTGEVYTSDSTTFVNKVFKISSGGTVAAVAGNGAATMEGAPFSPGAALSIPLLQPRGVEFDAAGNLFITDTGHRRVIRVSGGNATLVNQFVEILVPRSTGGTSAVNPFPSGVAVQGGNVYVANGNEQTVRRVTNTVAKIAGTISFNQQSGVTTVQTCNYSSSNCGDEGAALNAGLNILGSAGTPPPADLEGDQNGLFVLDQAGKGRVRYINLTGGTVTVAGVQVAAGTIRTIAGNGLASPYNGGLATGAAFNTPVGVATDSNNNLWISDTNGAGLRFVNRGANQMTIFGGTPAAQTVPPGVIVTVNKDAGPGAGDGVPVNQASFIAPQGLFVTSQGVYVVDSNGGPSVPPETTDGLKTSRIRFINTTAAAVTLFPGAGGNAITIAPGNIQTIAGGGIDDLSVGFATAVTFKGSSDIVVAGNGTIYVTDVGKKAVRRIDPNTGNVSALTLPAGKEYTGLGFDSSGRLLVANFTDNAVLRESGAGSGSFSNFGGTGGNLTNVRDVAGAADGSLYATAGPPSSTSGNHRIIRIDSGGTTSVIAGGTPGFTGDGGAAAGSMINIAPPRLVLKTTNGLVDVPETVNIVVSPIGEILFTDTNNNRVRRISGTLVTCVKTGTINIAGNNPAPVLTSISPNNRLVNQGAFTLTAIGSNFAPSSVIRWNGQARPTTFVSATELSAAIPGTDVTAAGTAQVTVFTPTPGGGTSSAVPFTITGLNGVPTITSLNPNTKVEGSPAFVMTVTGTNFFSGSQVRFDGSMRTTTFVSSTQVTAQIESGDLIGQGTASVTVFNPAPGGGLSNILPFTITPATAAVPVLTSISPTSINAGSSPFALNANGSAFTINSKVRWNGADQQTAFVSSTQLTAQIPANLVATQGSAQVTVFTPTPGGGTSAARTFTINPPGANPVPTISTLNPASVGVNTAFTLTVNGTGFVGGSVVRINGNSRPTTVVSATQLTAQIQAGDVAAAGNVPVTVFNPTPGGGTSTATPLRVAPKITSVSAASFAPDPSPIAAESLVAGFGAGLATGTAFASAIPLPTTLLGTTVKVTDSAGTERSAGLLFVTGGQVNYHVPPGTVDGLASVVVAINSNVVASGLMNITKVSPGMISFSGTGTGVAASVALRVKVDGSQSFESTARIEGGVFVPAPISLGPEGEVVYAVMYGTGIRNRTSVENISVSFTGSCGTVTKSLSAVLFEAALASGFIGVDQVNLILPRTLIGCGVVDVKLTVDGKVTNTVKLAIQ